MRSFVKFDHRPWAAKIEEHIDTSRENLDVIDIATGPGFLLIELAKFFKNPELTAHDATDEMLNIAENEAEINNFDISTIHSSAENIEARNNSFDIVTCKQLLHESESPARVISEIFRITKPDGKAFIIDFDQNKKKFTARMIKLFIRLTKGKRLATEFWKSYSGALQGKNIKIMMEKVGFKNVKYFQIRYNYFIFGEKK
jgi:ubiquinone/menaquinone biosynthesis C-methylase UbiE